MTATASSLRHPWRGLPCVTRVAAKCYNPSMKVVTGTVVNGKVEVPPDIEEGSPVAILVPGPDEPFTLSPSEEEELSQALEEIHGGNFVDGWALINEIKAKSRG